MKQYAYDGNSLLKVRILQSGGIASMVLGTLVGGLVTLGAIRTHATWSSVVWIVAWFLLVGWALGSVMVNLYPTIWTSDDGMWVSVFGFWRKLVPWSEVIEVRQPTNWAWVVTKASLVRTQRITPIHRLIGWIYGRTLSPSFLVNRAIEDFEDLIREIEDKSCAREQISS